MKRRARRIAIVATSVLAALVSVLVFTNWSTVRDHIDAWHFQLTRKTEVFDPFRVTPDRVNEEGVLVYLSPGLQILSTHARRSIICDPEETKDIGLWRVVRRLTPEEVVRVLEEEGHRVIEQRFPRRAYVAIRLEEEEAHQQDRPWGGVSLQPAVEAPLR